MNKHANNNKRLAFSLIELLVVIAIIGILMGLILGAIQKVRQASLRLSCQNQLKQIGLGLMANHDAMGFFPPGFRTPNTVGIDFTGWKVTLLPYLGENNLYTKIQSVPFYWTSDFDYFALSQTVPSYLCPADPISPIVGIYPPDLGVTFPVASSNYLGVTGKNRSSKDGLFFVNSRIRISDILDGASNTIAVGERPPSVDRFFGLWFTSFAFGDGNFDSTLGVLDFLPGNSGGIPLCPKGVPFGFQQPANKDDPCSFIHFWSYHPSGANFLFADGSVRLLPYSIGNLLVNLSTINGSEIISD